jgi:hypothetical protein
VWVSLREPSKGVRGLREPNPHTTCERFAVEGLRVVWVFGNPLKNFEGTLTHGVRGTLKRILRVVRGLREPLNVVEGTFNKVERFEGFRDRDMPAGHCAKTPLQVYFRGDLFQLNIRVLLTTKYQALYVWQHYVK